MIASDLDAILDEEEDRVLVRIHLSDRLLAVALWRADGRTHGRALQRDLPTHTLATLQGAAGTGLATPELTSLLLALDLGEILPPRPGHVVLLPSLLGMFVPWAATGAPELLHRCTAISILPSLVALWGRQSPRHPRQGTITVVPGTANARATRFHGTVLTAGVPDETRLVGPEATGERLSRQVVHADVVCFFAHGQGGPDCEDVGILLADGLLTPSVSNSAWEGMERVELWACRSGVNLPTDWLTPLVDDGFGLDVAFNHAGVRSTIGTLWNANDFVTACLVHRYRAELRAGASAPLALASAQRWWLAEAVPALERRLRVMPEAQAISSFLGELGADAPTSADASGHAASLGPVDPDARLPDGDVERLVRSFRSPLVWAGYRFLGVADRRPLGLATPPRPLTGQEQDELVRLLRAVPPETIDLHDAWDRWIEEACPNDGVSFAAPEAVRAARLYATRLRARPAHNLVRGLACIHEALVDVPPDQRATLRREAAWLWLELAMGEVSEDFSLLFLNVPRPLLSRVEKLAGGGVEGAMMKAWVAVLRAGPDKKRAAARTGWRSLSGKLDDQSLDAYRRMRLWGYAAELLLLADPTRAAVDELETLVCPGEALIEQAVVWSRWMLYLSLCHHHLRSDGPRPVSLAKGPDDIRLTGASPSDRLSQSRPGEGPDVPIYGFRVDMLPLRDLARATLLLQARMDAPTLRLDGRKELDRSLGLLEEAFWGEPSGEQITYYKTSGSPGRAWRGAGGNYLSASAREPGGQGRAAHFFSWLHLAADLRVGPQNVLASFCAIDPEMRTPLARLHRLVWARDHLVSVLEDVATLPAPSVGLDPFATPSADLKRELLVTGGDHASWTLAHGVEDFWTKEFPAATTAMSAERQLRWLDATIAETWAEVRRLLRELERSAPWDGKRLAEALDPGIRVADLEKQLRELPPGEVILGLTVGPDAGLLAFAVWNDGHALQQRVHVAPVLSGAQLETLFPALWAFEEADHGPRMGVQCARQDAWHAVATALDGTLHAVLREACHPARHLRIFAPGPLRALPAAGLTIGGVPLRRHFASVGHLPDLRFGRPERFTPASATTPSACTFGQEQALGETRFGGAAITTLRRWFPPALIAEPGEPVGTDIVEVEAIGRIAPEAAVLRFYGVGDPGELTPSSAGLRLSGGRTLTVHNTRLLAFGRCRAVELWAATSPTGELWGVLHRGSDLLPPLVRAFLVCGAGGVLDLAWPVHDLLKALVMETFSVEREVRPAPDALVLTRALNRVEDTLLTLRRTRFATVRDALHALDDLRRRSAVASGLDPSALVPFAPLAGAPSVAMPVADLLEVLTRPAQLAAFRWWGR